MEAEPSLIGQRSLAWLLNAASDPMLICDGQGRIVLVNTALTRLFGQSQAELVGQPVEMLMPSALRKGHAGLRRGYAENPQARPMGAELELTALRRDGREFPVEVSLSPLDGGEQGALVLATVRDISRRKRAELALQDSEARMRAVFETAVDGIITIDEEGTLERLNPAAEQMFGYAEAEVAGKNIAMLMPPPHRQQHAGYIRHYLQTGEKRIIGQGRAVEGLRKDGSVFPMELAVAEMWLGGRRMFTGLVRDITARKRVEQESELLLAELSSANEELTSFAYVVSHDLKAPLRAIGSLADWLAHDYAALFNEEGREHMRLLINRVHRMAGLIDGILQYSRVGRVRESQAAVDLNRVLADVIDLLAPPPSIAVTVAGTLPVVTAEPTRIRQVFHNLLANAIAYMDKPDGRVEVRCEDDGRYWRFAVQDNGPGIEARHFERIFQLFQTLAPRDQVESTGVGLTMVKKIVEMYQGRVWLESEPGQGSTFYFTYPKTATAVRRAR